MGHVANSLHQEHESDARHEPPVELADQSLVQRSHLLLAQVSQCFEARLDLLRSDLMILSRDLLELDVSLLLVGYDVSHAV